MDVFTYKGISAGKYVEGEIEALNQDEASHKLKEQKIIITNLVKGNKKKANTSPQKTESEKVKSLKQKIETYKKVINNLQDENKKLSKLLSNRQKIDSLV